MRKNNSGRDVDVEIGGAGDGEAVGEVVGEVVGVGEIGDGEVSGNVGEVGDVGEISVVGVIVGVGEVGDVGEISGDGEIVGGTQWNPLSSGGNPPSCLHRQDQHQPTTVFQSCTVD